MGCLKRGDGLWGEGKRVRRKMNGVGGESELRTDPQRKEQKWEVMGYRKNGMEEDEWRRAGANLRTDPQRKEPKLVVIGCMEKGRRKMNSFRGGSGLRTDPQRKEQKGAVLQGCGHERAADGESGRFMRTGRAKRILGIQVRIRFARRRFLFLLIYLPASPQDPILFNQQKCVPLHTVFFVITYLNPLHM